MKIQRLKLSIEHLDKKLEPIRALENIQPKNGWVKTIRNILNMSLRQLAVRLHVTPQAIDDLEKREALGTVTIKSLQDVADKLDMKLVYGFIPKDGSISSLVDRRVMEVAREIVMRTSHSMKLEDQENSQDRLQRAIEQKAEELKRTLPKYIWD